MPAEWRVATARIHPRLSISVCQCFSLKQERIAWKQSVNYLGVRLDRRLTFNSHVTDIFNKARDKLFPILSRKSRGAVHTELFTYAIPTWITHVRSVRLVVSTVDDLQV